MITYELVNALARLMTGKAWIAYGEEDRHWARLEAKRILVQLETEGFTFGEKPYTASAATHPTRG